jgi:hypothetical protein
MPPAPLSLAHIQGLGALKDIRTLAAVENKTDAHLL